MECLPPSVRGRTFYRPSDQGYEKTIRQLMEYRESLRKKRGARKKSD